MNETDYKVGFLKVATLEGDVIRGALLVTDKKTRPFEFRVSTGVKPSSWQKILYGSTLQRAVNVDLISLKLINSISEAVTMIFVDDRSLLVLRPQLQFPIAALQSMNELETRKLGQMPHIEVNETFASERDAITRLVQEMIQDADILEPFQRVVIAMESYHSQRRDDHQE